MSIERDSFFSPDAHNDEASFAAHYDQLSEEDRRAAFILLASTYLVSKELAQFATIDPLTELANRRGWDAEAERRIAIAQRRRTSFGYLLIDVDNFKIVNDELGHTVGDQVLQVGAEELRRSARADSEDFGGRLGGDELGAMVDAHPDPKVNDLKQAEFVAVRFRANFNQAITTELPEVRELGKESGLPLDVSIGVTAFLQGDTLAALHSRADAEMYKVKRQHHEQQGGSYR